MMRVDGRRLVGRPGRLMIAAAMATALSVAAAGPTLGQAEMCGWDELGDVTLRVAGETSSEETLDALATEFMERFPNVTIEISIRGFDDHMATVLNLADLPDAPDIIFGNQGYVTDGALIEAGLIIDLEPYYDIHDWGDWYGDGAMDQHRFTEDGRTFGEGPRWGISESADFVGVFYNKAKLTDLGLDVPASFSDFEDALAAAADAGELPIKLGNLEGWPATHAAGINQGAFWAAPDARDWVFGKAGADFASEANLAAFESFKGWVDAGYINEDANGLGYDDAWAQFAAGDGVFLPAGNWLTGNLRSAMGDDVGFFAPPPGDSGKVVSVAALSLPFHISSKSENPDLAAGFIDYVMSPQQGQTYFDHGRLPASGDQRDARIAWHGGTTDHADAEATAADRLTAETAAAWTRIAEDDGLIFFQDWASDTMFDTLTGSLQELIGDRITAEEFVNEVQDDWAAFHADR